MKQVNLYEVGEEVMVKAVIMASVIEDGTIKYKLKNELTGRDYGYLFTDDQLYPIQNVVKNTAPLMKGNTKGGLNEERKHF